MLLSWCGTASCSSQQTAAPAAQMSCGSQPASHFLDFGVGPKPPNSVRREARENGRRKESCLNRWAFEVQKTNFTQLQVPVVLGLNLSMARRAVEEQLKPSSVFARLAPHLRRTL